MNRSLPTTKPAALRTAAWLLCAFPAAAQDYHFDGSMSRQVLENYLERSISFTELLHDDLTKPRNSRGVDPKDNLRLIVETNAKFVGRALMVWGREKELPAFLDTAKPFAVALHKADPDFILQAAAFEIVTRGVEATTIPERVLREFGQEPSAGRNFRYDDMLYTDGRFVNHWGGRGSVPDMSRLETRMWFYFLVTRYIDAVFTKSKGGITPSGWVCEHLRYLVEFDNFVRSRNPGQPGKDPFIWGWDEITWFALMPERERNDWLRYAWKWLRDTDPNGHLQMPGSRVITPGTRDGPRWYWANTRSDACPNGSNTEETIREIWGTGKRAESSQQQRDEHKQPE
jgi:hypothetical protein